MADRWRIVGDGYFKSPGEPANDGKTRLQMNEKSTMPGSNFSFMLSEDRDYSSWDNFDPDRHYVGTRGEAYIEVPESEAQELAETILAVINRRRAFHPEGG